MKKRILQALSLALALMMLLTSVGLAETLQYPDRGAAVLRLQQALQQAGFYGGKLDGQYGKGTRVAVEAFQQAYGLTIDGKAGERTQSFLEALTGIKITPDDPKDEDKEDDTVAGGRPDGLFKGNYDKLVFGAEGQRVRTLQQALMALGFDITKVDGDYGTTTYKAVKAFQQTVGLTVDGKAGPKTLVKLESYFDSEGNVLTGPIVTAKPATDENLKYDVPTRTLRKGMSGLDVQYTQNRLKELKYYTGKLDGQFGTAMQTAVKAFQLRNGLKADGVIGSGTRKVLFGAGAIAADEAVQNPETHRTLRLGMSGADVVALQERLTALGYYNKGIDGQYGKGTVAAVKAFQARNNLTVDGVCGEDTAVRIYSDSAVDAGSTTTTPIPNGIPLRTLEKGDKGDDVASVQNRLKALGYYTQAVDGQYGSGTVSAVKFFQARNSLKVDGKVGSNTARVLFSSSAIAAGDGSSSTVPPTAQPNATPSKTLRFGDSGADVMLLQTRLIELGYLNAKADGKFGSTTLAALKAFQLRNGLTADGVAGSKTYKKLYSDSVIKPTDEPDDNGLPTRELYNGCKGEDVRLVQVRLKALGYFTSTVDGTYGALTTAAMIAFQQRNNLVANGRGYEAAYKVLFSMDAIAADGGTVDNVTPAPTYTTLKLGSTGNEVVRLQQMLQSLKYTVNVTGTYDDVTYAAVLAFQRRNDLDADGVAGKKTQTKLYSGNCITGDTALPGGNGGNGTTGNGGGPGSVSQVKLLHWFDDIKGAMMKYGSELLVYEPSTNSSYYVRVYSQNEHCDAEPVTKEDVATMIAAWGGKMSWKEKPVYVRLPNGTWCIASTHSMAHEENFIANNGFDGHICIHFPRSMDECILVSPENGVRHQNDIRKHWKAITGQDIPW